MDQLLTNLYYCPTFTAIKYIHSMDVQKNNPLHGQTLQSILEYLVETYGWEELSVQIDINCFKNEPSVQSSLKFLRKTPWARQKVESFYLYALRKNK
jgi:uncharacterized protein (DUF2132 family)